MVKERAKTATIITLIVIILILLAILLSALNRADGITTAYIEKALAEEITDNSDGTIRIKINPEVTIKNGVMQDLYFANYNETRLLQCKIVSNGAVVYDSGFVQTGDVIVGDYVKTDKLVKGKNEALAEIYSYNYEEKLISQTNVEIALYF